MNKNVYFTTISHCFYYYFTHAGPTPPSELNLRPVFARVPPPLYSCDDEVDFSDMYTVEPS